MKEYILDTNVFVRYFIRDVSSQVEKAKELFRAIEEQKTKGYVSILVIDELIWTLENFYKLKRSIYLPQLLKILAFANIKIIEIDKGQLMKIFGLMEKSRFDFTDLYLFFISENNNVFSFDKDFKKISDKLQ